MESFFFFFADEEKSSSVGVVQKESELEARGSQETEARVASGRDVEKERETVCSVDAKSSCSDSETQQGKDWIFSLINQNSFVPFFFLLPLLTCTNIVSEIRYCASESCQQPRFEERFGESSSAKDG